MKTRVTLTTILIFLFLAGCVASPATETAVAPTVAAAAPTSTLTPLPSLTLTPTALATPTPGLSARLSELQGGVEVKQPADTDFKTAAAGMTLQTLSQVRTLEDGRARIDLSSGTIIRIAPNSVFTLTVENPDPTNPLVRLKLLVGQLFVILHGGSVDVETPSGVASVLGSYMSVVIDPETGNATVECLEGSCHIDTPAGSYNFSTGRKVLLIFTADGGTPVPPSFDILTEDDLQDWLGLNPEVTEVQSIVEDELDSIPTATDKPKPTKEHEEPPAGPTMEKKPTPTYLPPGQ